MKFHPNEFKDISAEYDWLHHFSLLAFAQPGQYGAPTNHVILSSNHQSALSHAIRHSNKLLILLNGGGYPVETAAALGMLRPPQDSAFEEYARLAAEEMTFYLPPSLASAWGWKDGERHLGGVTRVRAEYFPNPALQKMPLWLLRLYSLIRLSGAQLVLLLAPLLFIGVWEAVIPLTAFILFAAILLATFWNVLPGGGWRKSGIVGLLCGIAAFALAWRAIVPLPLLFAPVIFLAVWSMGILLNGINKN